MDTQQEHVLQAVVLADAFEHQSRYGPLIKGGGKDNEGCESSPPFCLLPFLNTPLIAWTLESLSAGGVKNAFIIIKEGAKELQAWIDSSTFALPTASMTISIRSTQGTTEGDSMRELDSLPLTNNFLLTRAGFIGNLNLEKLVEEFALKRKKDTGLLMDCLVTPRTQSRSSNIATHILAPQKSNQLLHYSFLPKYPRKARTQFPLELFETAMDLAIRTDLESVGIDVCTIEVPALFVENFDYQSLRPDFVDGILTSDILGKSICCTLLGDEDSGPVATTNESRSTAWAGIVGDVSSYDKMSKLVTSRWSYPLVLDEIVPGSEERYEQRRGRLYLGKNLNLSRSCSLSGHSVIGSQAVIGEGSSIVNSIVGPDCTIGKGVTITDSYILGGVRIDDNVVITNSAVGEGATVGKSTKIERGSIIGQGVVVGEGAHLAHRRVATEEWDEDSVASTELGIGGQGYIWPTEKEALAEEPAVEDEDALDPRNLEVSGIHQASQNGYETSSSVSDISDAYSSSEEDEEGQGDYESEDSESTPPAIAGISALDTSGQTEQAAFQKECLFTLERSFNEDHTVENTLIELKTLRMASNVTLKKIIEVLIPFFVGRLDLSKDASNKEASDKVEKLVERWGDVITGLTAGQETGMIDVLLALQGLCATGDPVHPKLFPIMLQNFYENDIISEDGFIQWVKDPSSRRTGGETGLKLWSVGTAFVKALMEADDDDDSEEESD